MTDLIKPTNFDQAQQNFLAVGRILKKTREEHSYTLEHVAEITRITKASLRAIEEGDLDSLPGKVFARGFTQNYAKLLGIDDKWMMEAIEHAYYIKENPQAEHTPEEEILAQEAEEKIPPSFNLQVSRKALMSVGGGAALLLIVLIIALSGGEDHLDGNTQVMQAVVDENAPNKQPNNSNKVAATQTNPIISPLNLVLQAKESDWIYLKVDNKTAYQLRIEKNKKYEWPASEHYQLTMATGKTAGIYLNGEEIEVSKKDQDKLFEMKLNKFSLTQMNN